MADNVRNWVEEAYTAFIKDARDIEPTDPVKAIAAYFEKNATDELKARCKAEGKDAAGCWRFVYAVAKKALNGASGHIDPGVVYAIAMHWFEDVPTDWTGAAESRPKRTAEAKPAKEKTPPKKAPPKKAAAPRKPRDRQGFFFEMMDSGPSVSQGEPPAAGLSGSQGASPAPEPAEGAAE